MVARAWTDPQYRDLLLSNGDAAAKEMGFGDLSYALRIVPNTETTHNVIVCTLCSCYPVSLLGPSPGWYKSFAYRSRTVREPRAVLAEFGLELPGEVAITVWDSTSEARYMVLPVRPAGTEALGRRRTHRAGDQERADRHRPGVSSPRWPGRGQRPTWPGRPAAG